MLQLPPYCIMPRDVKRSSKSLKAWRQLAENFFLAEFENGDSFLVSPKKDLAIKIKAGGYIPKSGLLLANSLSTFSLAGLTALDIGTGETGFLANCLRSEGAVRVVGCDIDKDAIDHAKTASNISKEIEWDVSDVYGGIPDLYSFDFIVSNPPQMPMRTDGHHHDYGGSDGRKIVLEILRGSASRLVDHGHIVLLCFDFLGTDRRTNSEPSLSEIGQDLGFHVRILNQEKRSIRNGGETEKNMDWIHAVYPLYEFERNENGDSTYQLHILDFQKGADTKC